MEATAIAPKEKMALGSVCYVVGLACRLGRGCWCLARSLPDGKERVAITLSSGQDEKGEGCLGGLETGPLSYLGSAASEFCSFGQICSL